MHDLRHALRSLLKTPGFTLAAVLTLALGLGATLSLLAIFHATVLKPLPYPEGHRMVAIQECHGDHEWSLSAPNAEDLRQRSRTLSRVAYMGTARFDLTGLGTPQRVAGAWVSRDWFATLGVRPALGRFFENSGGGTQVVLSHGFWTRALGRDGGVLGRSLVLDGRILQVVGVAPVDYVCPFRLNPDVFVPAGPEHPDWHSRGAHPFRGLGRLAPGADQASAAKELRSIGADLTREHPQSNREMRFLATDLHASISAGQRKSLGLLTAASALLLGIACANVTGLFLARCLARRRDMMVRAALGAGLFQILRLHLAESLLVAAAGGGLGLGFAGLALRSLPLWLPFPEAIAALERPGLDVPVACAALGLVLAVCLVLAVVPTLQVHRLDLNGALREGGQTGGTGGGRTRAVLVVAELALACVLSTGAIMFRQSLDQALHADPGFQARGLVGFQLKLPRARYDEEARRRLQRELQTRLAQLPGVGSAGCSSIDWLGGGGHEVGFKIAPANLEDSLWLPSQMDAVDGQLLRTLQVPLHAGRLIEARDTADAPRVCVVTESLARAHFQERSPLGQRLCVGWGSQASPSGTAFEIVGVVGDVRHVRLDQNPRPRIFLSMEQMPRDSLFAFLRTEQTPGALRPHLERSLRELDPLLPLVGLDKVEAKAAKGLAGRRQAAVLMTIFSALALGLAISGVYAVLSYTVAQQRRETGIRMALGAGVGRVLAAVLKPGLRQVGLGIGLGLLLASAAGRLAQSELYGLRGTSLPTLALAVLVLSSAALLACVLPALRASRTQPAETLRSE